MDINEFTVLGRTLSFSGAPIAYFKARKAFVDLARKAPASFASGWQFAI